MNINISDAAREKIRGLSTADNYALIKTVTNAGHEWTLKTVDEVRGGKNIAGQWSFVYT